MIYTLGHSTYSEADFAAAAEPVDMIMDIRSHPGSAKWPQFNTERMQEWLPQHSLKYVLELGLGGWRSDHAEYADKMATVGVNLKGYGGAKFPKHQIAAAMVQDGNRPAWTNRGLYEYSWFTILPEFLRAADNLMAIGETTDVAIVCCEALYWKCHRSMVSDYLAYRGVESVHLMPRFTKTKGVRISRVNHSKILSDRLQRYDSRIIQVWEQWK